MIAYSNGYMHFEDTRPTFEELNQVVTPGTKWLDDPTYVGNAFLRASDQTLIDEYRTTRGIPLPETVYVHGYRFHRTTLIYQEPTRGEVLEMLRTFTPISPEVYYSTPLLALIKSYSEDPGLFRRKEFGENIPHYSDQEVRNMIREDFHPDGYCTMSKEARQAMEFMK